MKNNSEKQIITIEIPKVNKDTLVENIKAKHLKAVIDLINKSKPHTVIDENVVCELTKSDAEELMMEISKIASKLKGGIIAGTLWQTYDRISECVAKTKV